MEVCILNLNWKVKEKAALFALIFLTFLHFRAVSSLMAQETIDRVTINNLKTYVYGI